MSLEPWPPSESESERRFHESAQEQLSEEIFDIKFGGNPEEDPQGDEDGFIDALIRHVREYYRLYSITIAFLILVASVIGILV